MNSKIEYFDNFYCGKNIFITGHTGFKGSWLALVLDALGANVTGYAKFCKTPFDNFVLTNLAQRINDVRGDIIDEEKLYKSFSEAKPDIVFHLAAQPLVRYSYENPSETYLTNVMGTLNVLEAVRKTESVKAVVIITSDKCYQNNEWHWGYREDDKLGGHDPYSSSKACTEILSASYKDSYFNENGKSKTALATVRAGNVIGGGDWAADRIIPDCIRSFLKSEPVVLRNPNAVRPWQHVLEPLAGYMLLAKKMLEEPEKYSQPFNFGPDNNSCVSVEEVVKKFIDNYGEGSYVYGDLTGLHEASLLSLDISRAKAVLGWRPVWGIDKVIKKTAEWYKNFKNYNVYDLCISQIEEYFSDCKKDY